jgi:hypothetical protein
MWPPFGSIIIDDEKIKLRLFFKSYEIKLKNIKSIKMVKSINQDFIYLRTWTPFFQIIHNDKKLKNLQFYFSGKNQELIPILKKLGLKVE